MNSASASFTVSRLLLPPPSFTALARSASSMWRFVAMVHTLFHTSPVASRNKATRAFVGPTEPGSHHSARHPRRLRRRGGRGLCRGGVAAGGRVGEQRTHRGVG